MSVAGQPPVVATTRGRRASPAAGASTRWRPGSSPRPRSSSSSGSSIRPSPRSSAASTTATATSSSGSTTTRRCSRTTSSCRSIINNAPLGRDRAGARHGDRAHLRRPDRAGQLVGRVQDGRVHADGDLGLRGRHHVADRLHQGARPGRAQRRDLRGEGRLQRVRRPHAGATLDRRRDRARRSRGSRSGSRSSPATSPCSG